MLFKLRNKLFLITKLNSYDYGYIDFDVIHNNKKYFLEISIDSREFSRVDTEEDNEREEGIYFYPSKKFLKELKRKFG